MTDETPLNIDAEMRKAFNSVLLPAQELSREAQIRIIATMLIMFDVEGDVFDRVQGARRSRG